MTEEIIVLLGSHEDWPEDLATRLFDEGYGVVALQNVGLLEEFVSRKTANTVFVDTEKTSEKVWKLLAALKKQYPALELIAVATGPNRRVDSQCHAGTVTARLSWPTSTEALRRVLSPKN